MEVRGGQVEFYSPPALWQVDKLKHRPFLKRYVELGRLGRNENKQKDSLGNILLVIVVPSGLVVG